MRQYASLKTRNKLFMKHSYLIALLCTLSLTLYAQNPPYLISPTHAIIQNQDWQLSSSSGNIASGQITGINFQLVHIIHGIDATATASGQTLKTSNISVFPNPFINQLHIQAGSIEIDRVVLFNSIGKKVYDQKWNSNTIQLAFLPDGLYLLKLFDDNLRIIGSFTVIK